MLCGNCEMTELELKIYKVVRNIPKGKVMTYGQIACMVGNIHLSRVVGNVMHKNPLPFFELAEKAGVEQDFASIIEDKDFKPVPCHRVVDSQGRMGANFGLGGPAVQAKMLMLEGVCVDGLKVNLEKYQYQFCN